MTDDGRLFTRILVFIPNGREASLKRRSSAKLAAAPEKWVKGGGGGGNTGLTQTRYDERLGHLEGRGRVRENKDESRLKTEEKPNLDWDTELGR